MDTLTQMRILIAVTQAGSFTRAAEQLSISKALASKYIARLEAELGVRLLHRTTRRLNLTDAGQRYLERAGHILAEYDELEAEMRQAQSLPRGKLRLTAPTTFGELYLSAWLGQYQTRYPDVEIELYLTDRFVALIDEGYDMALRIGTLSDSSLVARRLGQTGIGVYATPVYLKRYGCPKVPKDLGDHVCILDTNTVQPDKWRFQGHSPQTVQVQGKFRVNSAAAVKALVLNHQGIGLCPQYVMQSSGTSSQQVISLLNDYPLTTLGIYALYPQQKFLPARIRTCIDYLVEILQGQMPWETKDWATSPKKTD